uniref:Uncharacterized protein n=1 Tax=Globodera rostochiensis TaxID=31243 RepID=A0A914HG71_GLORO
MDLAGYVAKRQPVLQKNVASVIDLEGAASFCLRAMDGEAMEEKEKKGEEGNGDSRQGADSLAKHLHFQRGRGSVNRRMALALCLAQ